MTISNPVHEGVSVSAGSRLLPLFVERRFAGLALVLALASLPMLAAMLVETRTIYGINVWIKPLKFSLSLVVYLGTLSFFARYASEEFLASRPWRAFSWIVCLCIVAEMAWIGGASANGIASHFNDSTPLMAALYPVMGLLAITLTGASLVLGIAIGLHREGGLTDTMRHSLATSLVLTFVLTVIAASVLARGDGHWVGGTRSDEGGLALFGWSRDGGDLRIAHFFATHAMHVLPLAGLVVASVWPGKRGISVVWLLGAAYAVLCFLLLQQALNGQPFLA